MLEKLINLGIDKEFFELSELGKLKSSCCPNSALTVIDYDKAKEKIIAEEKDKELQPPKSADALKILPEFNRIDFIELKGFEEFIKRDKKKDFNKKVEDFDLEGKIDDSLFVLNCILRNKFISFSRAEIKEYRHTEKNYFIVVDIELSNDPIKDRLVTSIFLSLKKSIHNIPDSNLYKLNKARLFNCNQLNSYYQNLLNKESEILK